jgi:hypothetical protein
MVAIKEGKIACNDAGDEVLRCALELLCRCAFFAESCDRRLYKDLMVFFNENWALLPEGEYRVYR